ncbi:glycosyltransferase [Actinospica sp.]|uniref:glycosyltransferase n=1 Tax=Actinospica sp. TaxID=1872142 RepID=UPI002C39F5B4|nr:glycosyltransferase [Actinospica sp.]HWG28574.1 glycosyltransferase [Actinospica sp.]
MRIVRIANFVSAESGGLRTALHGLGSGYVTAGHEAILIVPGDGRSDVMSDQGRVITLPGMPAAGARRMLVRRAPVTRLLEELAPDRLEVSDRSTLRWVGTWARRRGIPAMMISHENLTGRLTMLPPVFARAAVPFSDFVNRRSARDYDRIVCCTGWAASEFERLKVDNLLRIPLGVDLETFSPARRSRELRDRYAARDEVLIVYAGRLAPEKEPERALDALELLRRSGIPAALVVAGSGVLRERMEKRATAAELPVRFLGFVHSRPELAALLASADIALAPGPIETFCLSALESLACGTPVVASTEGGVSEVVGEGGVAATGESFVEGVRELLAQPAADRRAQARARAERFGWSASVAEFLAAHHANRTVGTRRSRLRTGVVRPSGAAQPGGRPHHDDRAAA